eukprot:CAMPEP_0181394846 /NCGR_PEP_ID=MMETSP1106-20121128/27996_1 /TAXON_ID=81844 /ORGANISM="Mantoniella antarctica, Strain SL-175" /LENGTH=1558 /DNA_ID=CAMNT_0023516371 /DNA_START=271 /DNA_END=4945 /DNA_ORIENTATION=-
MADEAGLLKAVTNVTSEPPIEQGQMFDSNERAAVLEDFVSQLRPLVEQTDDQKVMEETVRTTIQLLDVSSREPWIDQASAVHIAPLEEDGKRLGSFEATLFQCNLKENIGFAENAADSAFVAVGQQLISARCPGLRIDRYGSQHAKNAVEALRRTAHTHLARNNAAFFDREIQQNSRFTFRDGLFNAMSEDFVDIPPDVLQKVYLGKLRQSCNDGDISRTAAGDWLVLQALCDAFKISIILVLQEPQGAPSYVHFKHVGVHQNAAFTCFLSYASGKFQSLSRTEGISMTVGRETVTRTPAGDWLVLQALCDAFKISIILVLQGPQGAPSYVHFKHVGVHQNAAFTCFLSYASGKFQSLSRTEGISMTVGRETVTRTPAGDWLVLQALCDAFKISIILVLQGPQGAPSYVHFKHVGVHQNAAFTCFLSYASGKFQSLSRTEGISMTVGRETVTRTEICQTIESPIQTHLENVVAEEILDAELPLRVHIHTLRGEDSLALEMQACDTIGDIKAKIQAERDINCLEQRLFFADKRLHVRHAGAQLDDHRTLTDCDIQDECSLYLVFRLQGGGPSGDGGGSVGGRNSTPGSNRGGDGGGGGRDTGQSSRDNGQSSNSAIAVLQPPASLDVAAVGNAANSQQTHVEDVVALGAAAAPLGTVKAPQGTAELLHSTRGAIHRDVATLSPTPTTIGSVEEDSESAMKAKLKDRCPDFLLKTLFFTTVEFGDEVKALKDTHKQRYIHKGGTEEFPLISALETKLGATDRDFDLDYHDIECDSWCELTKETELVFLSSPATIAIRYKSPPGKFSSNAFLDRERRTFRAFKDVPGMGRFKLREPQENALLKLRTVLRPAAAGSRFMTILPTGSGKTLIMALAPFMMDATNVLVITPNNTILEQVQHEISEYYLETNNVGKSGNVRASVKQFKVGLVTGDVNVTNIQSLVETKKKKGENEDVDNQGVEEEHVDELKANARTLLEENKPDLVIIDEGHHNPANSWEVLSRAALECNANCKFLLVTATPQRGDMRNYGLPRIEVSGMEFYYLYTRKAAEGAKYIKSTKFYPIKFNFSHPTNVSRYEEENYIYSIIDPAVQNLIGLRQACGEKPLRMLVTARTNKAAEKVVEIFNKRSDEKGWGLLAKAVTGNQKLACRVQSLILFNCDYSPSSKKKIIDVVVQVQMLGEGYNNRWIAVSAFVFPAKSVGPLAQIHGRALRDPPFSPKEKKEFPQSLYSHLYYHEEVTDIVNQYRDGVDEKADNLFAEVMYKTLRDAHIKLHRFNTAEGVKEIRERYVDYHNMYEEQRGNWDPIPAEVVANKICEGSGHPTTSLNLRVIDFGCGQDGLFEAQLAEKIGLRDGGGQVLVLALDVHPLASAKYLSDVGSLPLDSEIEQHIQFTCETWAGDYNSFLEDESNRKYTGSFDVGVFVLAFWFTDAFGLGLRTAARAVKPKGTIHIVLGPWKLGINPKWPQKRRDLALHTWKTNFNKQDTGFKVNCAEIPNGRPRFAYIELTNVTAEKLSDIQWSDRIAKLSLKDVEYVDSDEPTPKKPRSGKRDLASGGGQNGAKGRKL